eukprot:TRINITY_DN8171_c0_g1_i8.p1 TRINITY_DN8171_c0_g1~~TRINITY_DN8171_c0_g1_i8.p1  ORF type:complete len:910 (+),score=164.13 TRINITY_DN8171_c0_g1_i8:101-2731(+)
MANVTVLKPWSGMHEALDIALQQLPSGHAKDLIDSVNEANTLCVEANRLTAELRDGSEIRFVPVVVDSNPAAVLISVSSGHGDGSGNEVSPPPRFWSLTNLQDRVKRMRFLHNRQQMHGFRTTSTDRGFGGKGPSGGLGVRTTEDLLDPWEEFQLSDFTQSLVERETFYAKIDSSRYRMLAKMMDILTRRKFQSIAQKAFSTWSRSCFAPVPRRLIEAAGSGFVIGPGGITVRAVRAVTRRPLGKAVAKSLSVPPANIRPRAAGVPPDRPGSVVRGSSATRNSRGAMVAPSVPSPRPRPQQVIPLAPSNHAGRQPLVEPQINVPVVVYAGDAARRSALSSVASPAHGQAGQVSFPQVASPENKMPAVGQVASPEQAVGQVARPENEMPVVEEVRGLRKDVRAMLNRLKVQVGVQSEDGSPAPSRAVLSQPPRSGNTALSSPQVGAAASPGGRRGGNADLSSSVRSAPVVNSMNTDPVRNILAKYADPATLSANLGGNSIAGGGGRLSLASGANVANSIGSGSGIGNVSGVDVIRSGDSTYIPLVPRTSGGGGMTTMSSSDGGITSTSGGIASVNRAPSGGCGNTIASGDGVIGGIAGGSVGTASGSGGTASGLSSFPNGNSGTAGDIDYGGGGGSITIYSGSRARVTRVSNTGGGGGNGIGPANRDGSNFSMGASGGVGIASGSSGGSITNDSGGAGSDGSIPIASSGGGVSKPTGGGCCGGPLVGSGGSGGIASVNSGCAGLSVGNTSVGGNNVISSYGCGSGISGAIGGCASIRMRNSGVGCGNGTGGNHIGGNGNIGGDGGASYLGQPPQSRSPTLVPTHMAASLPSTSGPYPATPLRPSAGVPRPMGPPVLRYSHGQVTSPPAHFRYVHRVP